LISKQILRYNLTLADLVLHKKELVARLLTVLIKTNSPLVKKTQLKKLNKLAPWCLVTLKCLLQAYADKIKKSTANHDVCKKLRIKTLQCLVNYFESSQNNIAFKEWEFLKILLISLKQKYNLLLKDQVDFHLWQTVYLGTFIVQLF
jgi:BarA-like signal transduction histidine kinase